MEPVTFNEIIEWTVGLPSKLSNISFTGVSTDSRNIKPGELYVPLKGENFDGHAFIDEAIKKGAAAYLSSEGSGMFGVPGIFVADTLTAYQEIAKNYLKKHRVKVVAVTGSNGKTTTKDIIFQILRNNFHTVATEKNFNNEVGVPRTILGLDKESEVLVIELGMRGAGQIRSLARIVEPDVSVITNIGEAHFELLGSYQAIAQAKCEILEHAKPEGATILNADDKWFKFCSDQARSKILSFGASNKADVKLLKKRGPDFNGYFLTVDVCGEIWKFHLPLLGEHNILNTLAAIAVTVSLGVPQEKVLPALESLEPTDKRMEVLKNPEGWTILNDTYNASPSSVGRALDILKDLKAEGSKYAVLGDMLELGEISLESHRNIGALVYKSGADELHTVGELGKEIAEGAKAAGMPAGHIFSWKDNNSLAEHLIKKIKKGDLVLVKGSRRMKMEEISKILAG